MDNSTNDSVLLNAILEATIDGIIVIDRNGVMIRVNAAAAGLFRYEEDQMLGRNVGMLMPKDVAKHHDGYIARYLKTGEKRIIGIGRDVEGRRNDGSLVPLQLTVGTARVDDQPVFVGILHDLTQRRATQDALARSQRLDAIGQMTGGVAHDFNNLLTVIIGNLELLQMRGAGNGRHELVQDALDAAEMGADLTSRLMVFARRGDLKPIRADLREACGDALAILKRALGSSYTIRTEFEPDLHQVMVDPVQLQSALMNLALNARDAMAGRGTLLIAAANVTIDDSYMAQEVDVGPGDYVRLSVSDDGEGMSLEAQRRAFEPFFTTKSDSGGTGLGLAMVYGFVRQSGGHVTLYSEPGLGTSIGLYFPALPGSGDHEELPTVEPRSAAGASPGQGETVLIVEDNPRVREVTIKRVLDLGYRVEVAENGDAAYAMLRSGIHADILFSDLVMPGELNGYDLAAKVEAEFPDLKVLLTSGYASDVATPGKGHGRIYELLHKPYRQSDLSRKLQALLAEDPDH